MSPSLQRALALGSTAIAAIATTLVTTPAAHADGPGVGVAWVVSVGDSYISGEAGRWAGNSNNGESYIDAGGASTYFDNASHTAETINRCHRSFASEISVGSGVNGLDLACSGATTATVASDSNGYFKPGLDFYNGSAGQGQALMLQNFAATHNVKLVAVSIGGNDFNFGSIVQQCVTDFLGSPSWWKDYCNDDSVVTNAMASSNVAAQRANIKNAFLNIRTAMRDAGYADTSWTLEVQNYVSPLPNGSSIRYSESGYSRQNTGGCGFWNNDANYANSTLLPTINNAVFGAATDSGMTNIKTLNLSSAFNGRRLCENTVGLIEEKGLAGWWSTGAVDQTEWVNQIRTVSTANSDYYIQESLHPNYWGQRALANCLLQAYNGGAPKSGTCVRGANGLNAAGEPNMVLQ
ncbi:hypothetical protein Back2_03130 [Nocardioides baekrokdamisoli]|uniref:SGNH hydrolase-type esterase domain-containing protein n=1 Tax=Nocardioides baekrokdamisoli TaxID=1804624 RepID=A0A3G9ICG0_9ACTN|nr:hypothetical protein [Nocardioides baekrokdamisoli]BBH16026.1 hypothetical protein Back2_03130 [Nocardioides baekrokdamisoli]